MKAYLRELIAPAQTKLVSVHYVREYLQARILQSLQRAGAMQTLAFHGGTCLRILYNIPRYSEDLDDPATLLAGKLHAILQRGYLNGARCVRSMVVSDAIGLATTQSRPPQSESDAEQLQW